jgi:hypothetical protein
VLWIVISVCLQLANTVTLYPKLAAHGASCSGGRKCLTWRILDTMERLYPNRRKCRSLKASLIWDSNPRQLILAVRRTAVVCAQSFMSFLSSTARSCPAIISPL